MKHKEIWPSKNKRRCPSCELVKDFSEYHRSKDKKNGIHSYCKSCFEARRYKNEAAIRARNMIAKKKRMKNKAAKESSRLALEKHRNKYPERAKARIAVREAIRTGKLLMEKCVVCGELKTQAHHPDYSKPLEVVWLCTLHHGMAGRKRKQFYPYREVKIMLDKQKYAFIEAVNQCWIHGDKDGSVLIQKKEVLQIIQNMK